MNKPIRRNSYLSLQAQPLVSIITATYNAEKYLEGCILSVINQTYDNFEYIIIDGGSTDQTIDIIKKHQHKLSYWISEPDQGIYDAWNKGLSKAKGDWVAFIGADDEFYLDALQTYVGHISQNSMLNELEFVSSRIELVTDDTTLHRIVGEAWTWERFRQEMTTWHVGAFHSKRLFVKYGLFDTAYKISGDYELLLRPKEKLKASFIDKPTVKMRIGGVSNVNLTKASEETYKAKIKNGVIPTYKAIILKYVDRLRLQIRQMSRSKVFKS